MISKTSPEWPGVKAWLQLAIETTRTRLESADCGIKEADLLRGKILGYREIVAHVEPSAALPPSEPARPPGTGY